MTKKKRVRLNARQQEAIVMMKLHGPVVVTRLGADIEMTLADGAPMFDKRTFQSLYRRGIFVAAGDGLVEGASQTYRINV